MREGSGPRVSHPLQLADPHPRNAGRDLQPGERFLQREPGAFVVDVGVRLRQPLLGALLGGFGARDVDVLGALRQRREDA